MALWEITLPPGFEFTVRVKTDPAATAPTLSPVTTAVTTAAWPADVEKILERFEKSGKTKSWPHRVVAARLVELGYQPAPPSTGSRAYLLWTAHGTKSVSVYQEGGGLVVDSKPLLPFALGLPGASSPKGKHPRVKWAYSLSVDVALEVAEKIREYADA